VQSPLLLQTETQQLSAPSCNYNHAGTPLRSCRRPRPRRGDPPQRRHPGREDQIARRFGVLPPLTDRKFLLSAEKVRLEMPEMVLRIRGLEHSSTAALHCFVHYLLSSRQSLLQTPSLLGCCGRWPFPGSPQPVHLWPPWRAALGCQIKSQCSYLPLNAGFTGQTDPLSMRSKHSEGLSCCLLCSFETSTLLNTTQEKMLPWHTHPQPTLSSLQRTWREATVGL